MKSYLEELKESLSESNTLLELYKCKLSKLEQFNTLDNETLEIINNKIEYLKTAKELKTLERIIKEKSDYFTSYSKTFDFDYAEMLKNFDTVIAKAKNKQNTSEVIDKLLKSVNWKALDTSKEGKVMLYNKLKKLV